MIVELAALHDQVVDHDGTSVVMVGSDIIVMSPLATHLVALLRDGRRPLQDLAAGLVGAFGDPVEVSSSEDLVGALVADLQHRGVVRVVSAR